MDDDSFAPPPQADRMVHQDHPMVWKTGDKSRPLKRCCLLRDGRPGKVATELRDEASELSWAVRKKASEFCGNRLE
jgi:hypothetical protein